MSLGSEKQQIRFDGHSTRLDSVLEDADTLGPNSMLQVDSNFDSIWCF